MNTSYLLKQSGGWIFGTLFFVIGIVNTFWGNDPFFGLFILFGSFVYFPPSNVLFTKMTSFSIPVVLKVLFGLFILWAALGVGELFDKVELMLRDIAV